MIFKINNFLKLINQSDNKNFIQIILKNKKSREHYTHDFINQKKELIY